MFSGVQRKGCENIHAVSSAFAIDAGALSCIFETVDFVGKDCRLSGVTSKPGISAQAFGEAAPIPRASTKPVEPIRTTSPESSGATRVYAGQLLAPGRRAGVEKWWRSAWMSGLMAHAGS